MAEFFQAFVKFLEDLFTALAKFLKEDGLADLLEKLGVLGGKTDTDAG